MERKFILGVDIGGTHLSCALVDVGNDKMVQKSRLEVRVNSNGSADEILKAWKGAVKTACSQGIKPEGIGVAMPGPFDYENGICAIKGVGKYEALFGINIKEIFSHASGIDREKIKFINDASAFAIGEYYAGAGKGCGKIIALTLGTGFGSTIIEDGKIITEGRGIPEGGMFWNASYKEGIADDYFSTRWFEKEYCEKSGRNVRGVQLIAQMVSSDESAQQTFNEFSNNLVEFLLSYIAEIAPDVLVIGGSIAKSHQLFLPALEREIKVKKLKTEIKISVLRDDAAIIGSAMWCGKV